MGNLIAVVGPSGSGKSTSLGAIPELNIVGLPPKETVLINVTKKPLPFRGWKANYGGNIRETGNYAETSSANAITEIINFVSQSRPDIKNIVIEDGQYILSFMLMDKAKESGYAKFTDIGVAMNNILKAGREARSDLNIIFTWHPEEDSDGNTSMKSCGKMITAYLTLEGLFTIILYTKVSKAVGNQRPTYQFVTNNDGNRFPAKSPVGLYTDLYIPNDMGYVIDKIREYYEN